jgi:uncharacterized glyoxalase superfamily protein PhnB
MNGSVKLINICPVFISNNAQATLDYYVNILDFTYAKHFNKKDNFAAIYKDSVEILIFQNKKGEYLNNISKYGVRYDLFICTDTLEGVDIIYREYLEKGIKIISKPTLMDDGCYEFIFEDIDGRYIGIGRIKDRNTFFNHSNYINKSN